MDKLVCDECGTIFNCGALPGKSRCWCMDLPNLRDSFDLAGSCVCPDCMTLGKAKEITRMRKIKKQQRVSSAVRTKVKPSFAFSYRLEWQIAAKR